MSVYICSINLIGKPLNRLVMNTNIEFFSSLIASDPAYRTLIDMIDELDLEVKSIELHA